MPHTIIFLAVASGFLVLSPVVYGQPANQASRPHFSGQTPDKAQKIFQQFEGNIRSIDTNSLTLTIEVAGKPRRFQATGTTEFTGDNHVPATLSDATTNDIAVVTIARVYGQPDKVVAVNFKKKSVSHP